MAEKTFDEIYQDLETKKDELLPELTSTSETSIWKLILEIFATGLHRLYEFFERAKTDIEAELSLHREGTIGFYKERLLQESDIVTVYHDETSHGLVLYPLLAGNGIPTATRIGQLQVIINGIKLLGFPIRCQQMASQTVKIDAVYQISESSGLSQAEIETNIDTSITDFFTNLAFHEGVVLSRLIQVVLNENAQLSDFYIVTPSENVAPGNVTLGVVTLIRQGSHAWFFEQ